MAVVVVLTWLHWKCYHGCIGGITFAVVEVELWLSECVTVDLVYVLL